MLHEIFESSARLFSDSPAVRDENYDFITYQELDDYSNQLAHALLERGIQPQRYVLFFSERCIEQVVVMLALSKIGAIYTPLSIDHDGIRLSLICNAVNPGLLLLSKQVANQIVDIPVFAEYNKIILEEIVFDLNKYSKTKPVVDGLNDQMIAYTVCSSGTTGTPKIIPIKHSGLSYWRDVLLNTLEHKVTNVLATTSIDFDAHVWEYLMAWSFGARLSIASDTTRKHPEALSNFIATYKISDATLPPAMLRTFSHDQINEFKDSGLCAIYSTGEACTRDIILKYDRFSVYNCYGPTETTFGYSIVLCAIENFHNEFAPIGNACGEEVRHKIVNLEGEEAKDGEEGELWITSPHLTPGYLNAKNTNIEGVWYKTGDKFLASQGFIYYVGRLNQLSHIKIRGQFVDITGIETVLREHPAIKDAYVVFHESQNILVAFIIYESAASISGLRDFCYQRSLHAASIPAYFISIESPPLNSSGKVHRKALAGFPIILQRDGLLPYVLPQNQLEQEIIKIWSEVLNPGEYISNFQIGIYDEFFLIGGDSIKAMLLINLIKEKFKIQFSILDINSIEKITPKKLSKLIQSSPSIDNVNQFCFVLREGDPSLPPIFLIHPITGMADLSYRDLAKAFKFGRKIVAINSPALLGCSPELESMEILAAEYLNIIRAYYPVGPINLVGWSSGGAIAYQIALVAESQSQEISLLGIIDEPSPNTLILSNSSQFGRNLESLAKHLIEQFASPFELKIEDLEIASLSKEEQVNSIFGKILKNLPSRTPKHIEKIFLFVKAFLLISISQKVNILKNTSIFVFHTKPTEQDFISVAIGSPNSAALGWDNLTEIDTPCVYLPGDHFTIINDPKTISKITQALDRAIRHQSNKFDTKISAVLSLWQSKQLFFNPIEARSVHFSAMDASVSKEVCAQKKEEKKNFFLQDLPLVSNSAIQQ
jgi:acyl-CoA synthetase (AMP-forming)/AMP-acid ligase II/thioesterase domain-containing protein/acyl carrier protein